ETECHPVLLRVRMCTARVNNGVGRPDDLRSPARPMDKQSRGPYLGTPARILKRFAKDLPTPLPAPPQDPGECHPRADDQERTRLGHVRYSRVDRPGVSRSRARGVAVEDV